MFVLIIGFLSQVTYFNLVQKQELTLCIGFQEEPVDKSKHWGDLEEEEEEEEEEEQEEEEEEEKEEKDEEEL